MFAGIVTRTIGTSALAGLVFLHGCANTISQYQPRRVAQGELILQYDGAFAMYAGGKRVARGLTYKGLSPFVVCVPTAHEQARLAERDGRVAVGFSATGGSLGAVSLGLLAGAIADGDNRWAWLGSGLVTATIGVLFAGFGRKFRNSANGHAVDALNFYNDSVGSLGARCNDLTYPAPAGPTTPVIAPVPSSVPQS